MKVIKLTLYRGKKLLFNEDGSVENENQTIKIQDGTEWLTFLKYIQAQGYCKVVLESVVDLKSGNAVPKDYYEMIKKQLIDACTDEKTEELVFRLEFAKETIKVGNAEFNADKLAEGSGQKSPEELKAYKKELRDKIRAAGGSVSNAAPLEKLEELAKEL